MKRRMLAALLALTLILAAPAALAGSAMNSGGDSEAELRARLEQSLTAGEIAGFYCDDYDADGAREAFAYVRLQDYGDGSSRGDIWFVNGWSAQPLREGSDYWDDEFRAVGTAPSRLFSAGEYRTTSSVTCLWAVCSSVPTAVEGDVNGIWDGDGDTPLFATVDAYDAFTDGTGHTWKTYFFYLEGRQLREYGAIPISREQFLTLAGASEILDRHVPVGARLTSILYRANHVIHLNFTEDGESGANSFVTVKYHGGAATLWEEGEGRYETASNPGIASYPATVEMGLD